jgi:peptide/nickel transport system permease protein
MTLGWGTDPLLLEPGMPGYEQNGPTGKVSRLTTLRAILSSTEGRLGAIVGLLVLALIICGPFIAPYSPTELNTGLPLSGPSLHHLLGTDQYGRDIFSRVLNGGDSVLIVPLIATTISYLIGGPLGLISAYATGRAELLLLKLFDAMLTFPPLLLVLVVLGAFGTSWPVLVLTVAFVQIPYAARIVRGTTQTVVHQEYVVAAQARGESTIAIFTREIAPNLSGPVLADFALRVTYAIIFVATLSFLGLGAQPPSSNWGLMVAESEPFLTTNPLAAIAPAACIGLVAFSLNLLSDALAKYLGRYRADREFGV